METNALNSCLMLAVNLDTPVSLGCVFDSADLKDTGVELESHITLLYAQAREIPYTELLNDIKEIVGYDDYKWLYEMIENEDKYRVLDLFDLGKFENDSDYIILKLRKGTELYRILKLINKGLSIKYEVKSDFADYIPHVSLAELEPGTAQKYMESETLLGILDDSIIGIEDLLISYGASNEPEDRKQKYLTNLKCIDRYFRLERLKKELKEL